MTRKRAKGISHQMEKSIFSFFLERASKSQKKESEQFERVKSSDIGRFVVLCLAEEKKKEKVLSHEYSSRATMQRRLYTPRGF